MIARNHEICGLPLRSIDHGIGRLRGNAVNVARGLFHSLGRRRPIIDGELQTPHLSSPVTVRRDDYGIPHINAANDRDAWYALGFCQGQDRAYQLESLIRSVRGTVAEVVGVPGLAIDRLSRRVGIYQSAVKQFAVLDGDIRQMLDAFAQGVKDGRDIGSRRRPHEFTLLHVRPTAWTAADTLGYLKFISLVISTNWAEELARYKILLEDGVAALEALEPESAAWLPVTDPPNAKAGRATSSLLREAWQLVDLLGLNDGGSNAWAISGERTATGRPILANDQHLAPSLPTHYYLAHVTTPDWGIAGGSFVGSPGFFVGHNGHAAWGVTVGNLDNTDLFIEEIGSDGRSVREGGRFVPCTIRQEKYRVRGADDLAEEVLETDRGPIVGPALDGRPGAISMSATWLRPAPVRSVFTAPS